MKSGLRRAFRNQGAPVPYAPRGQSSGLLHTLGGSDLETYMRAYGVSAAVYVVVSTIATAVAKPAWKLYRKQPQDGRVRYSTSDQGSDMRTEVVQHQALKVWNQPNDFMTNTAFVKAIQQHRELTGEAWWLVDYAGPIPAGLWPVRPDRMEPVPSRENFLAGYVYTGPNGERIPFSPSEVIMQKDPHPLDPYRGLGPIQSILVDIDADRYAAAYNRAFFVNGAEPGGVLQTPNELGEGEFDELTARWRETHQGVNRAHKVALLENGVTWQQTSVTQKDMEFSNLRVASRDISLLAWGLHKHIVGVADDVNRANAITAEEIFQDQKVTPRLDDIKDTLNHQFLPLFGATGQGVEFDYINPRPVNREADALELQAKAQAALWLVQAGYDPDDVCMVVGLPRMGIAAIERAAQAAPAGGDATLPAEMENLRKALLNRARKGALL